MKRKNIYLLSSWHGSEDGAGAFSSCICEDRVHSWSAAHRRDLWVQYLAHRYLGSAPPLAKSTPSKIVNREPFLPAQAPTDWATSLKNISIKHPDNKNGIYQTFEYLAAYLP